MPAAPQASMRTMWSPGPGRRRRCSGAGTRRRSRRFSGSDGDVHRSRVPLAKRLPIAAAFAAPRPAAASGVACVLGRVCSPWRACAVLWGRSWRTCTRQPTRRPEQTRHVRSHVRDVPVRSMRSHADATTASSSPPRCSARRRACTLASAEQRGKVCAVLRICSCAMPERRMPRKVFFSLRTGSRTRAWMSPAPRTAARETAGRVGVLQKSTGITAVFVCVEVSPQVSRWLLSRSSSCRSRRSVRSRHATPKKKLRRTVDSKKKRD